MNVNAVLLRVQLKNNVCNNKCTSLYNNFVWKECIEYSGICDFRQSCFIEILYIANNDKRKKGIFQDLLEISPKHM